MAIDSGRLRSDDKVDRARNLAAYSKTEIVEIQNAILGRPDRIISNREMTDFLLSCEKCCKAEFTVYDSETSPYKFIRGQDPSPLSVKELVYEALKAWDSEKSAFPTFWKGFLKKFIRLDYDIDIIYSSSTKNILKALRALTASTYPELDQDYALEKLINNGYVKDAVRLAYAENKSASFLNEREEKFYDEFYNSRHTSLDDPHFSGSDEDDPGNASSILESQSTPVSTTKGKSVEDDALDAANSNETMLSMLEDNLAAYAKSRRLGGQTLVILASACILIFAQKRGLEPNEAVALFDSETEGLELVSQGWQVLRGVIVDQGKLPQEQDLANALGYKSKSAFSNRMREYREFLEKGLHLQK